MPLNLLPVATIILAVEWSRINVACIFCNLSLQQHALMQIYYKVLPLRTPSIWWNVATQIGPSFLPPSKASSLYTCRKFDSTHVSLPWCGWDWWPPGWPPQILDKVLPSLHQPILFQTWLGWNLGLQQSMTSTHTLQSQANKLYWI